MTGESWGDIPMAWEKCEKHGWAGTTAPCPYCEKQTIARMANLAHVAKIPNRPLTTRMYVEAWLARSDEATVTKILTDPWTRGKTVIEIQDHWFPKEAGTGKSWKELIDGDGTDGNRADQ